MRENNLRKIWAEGGNIVNGWLHIANSFAAEAMAHQGWDSLTIDMQHGPVDYQAALPMLQAISTTEVVPLARVPWNEPGIIMKMLDAGCYGLICPMVNTREQAEAFISACRYPPQGARSFGPTRVKLYAGQEYHEHANDTVLTIAMIETSEALENLDAILSVPGLDGIYVGPADLSQSLAGTPIVDFSAAYLDEALDKILAGCEKHGIYPGIHTGSPQQAIQMLEKGFRLTTISSDAGIMMAAAKKAVAEVKGTQVAQSTGMY